MGAVEAFDAGYTALVSVMPPGAKVTGNSKLSEADAGKAPALRGYDGHYHGYNWMNSRPSRDSVQQWINGGSSVGFLASEYPAIDIDIMNEDISAAVVQAVVEEMGPCLIRTGQYPKRLLIFRSREPLRSFDMHYGRWSKLLGAEDKHLIQFLGRGRQYVMFGTHPRTMQPYTIDDPGFCMMLGPESLPVLDPDQVVKLFNVINRVMDGFGFTTSSNAEARVLGGDVDQDELKAPSVEAVSSLIERVPNNLPDRDDYISMGYAIKAACQDDTEAGFDIFADWCARWDQGGNDPAVVRQDWDKMVGPYRMGWDYLMHRGSQLGADISDFRFGPADPRPEAAAGGAPAEPGTDPDAEAIRASQEALAAAAAADPDATLSDRWLAQRFVATHGQNYMLPIGGHASYVYHWDGKHWQLVPKGQLLFHVGSFMASYTSMARQLYENPKEQAAAAMRLGSTKAINAVHAQVVASRSLAVKMSQLDADPDLLDTPSGPVHLPTGELLKPAREYRLTKSTTIDMDPTTHCPVWVRFVEEVTRGDRQLAFYLQCLSGYALTGHTREQVFPFFIGDGGNGKSVWLKVLHEILDDMAVSVPVELFQVSRFGGSPDYQLARIHGARLVTTSETKAGGVWDEQRVKQLTGEDKISARHIYGHQFEFDAQCTLIVAGNHSPDLEEVTDAMTRRIRVVPFDFKPAEADKFLVEKLMRELPGIFAWCVQGAMAWYQHSLPECASIVDVTKTYLDSQDTLGQWARDVLVATGDHESELITNKELYDSYAAWCRADGMSMPSHSSFSKRVVGVMRAKGMRRRRSSTSRGWTGGHLRPVEAAPPNVLTFPSVAPKPPRG